MRLIKLNLKLWIKIYFKRDFQEMKKIMNETPINKTIINNNILMIKMIFLILLLQKYK